MTVVTQVAGKNINNPALAPRLTMNAFPSYSGPGYVEIKPHSVGNIKDGLKQLNDQRKERIAKGKTIGSPYLLTYTLNAVPAEGGSTFEGYVLKPKASSIINADNQPKVTQASHQAWLDGLGDWWRLRIKKDDIVHSTFPGPEHPFGKWLDVAGPQVTGSMLEHALRNVFVEALGVPPLKHLTQKKLPIQKGPDIDFLEVAEFLYELDVALARAA